MGMVPNDPRPDNGLKPRGWGALLECTLCNSHSSVCIACSIGFRSGDRFDHSVTFHYLVAFTVCFGSLSICPVKRHLMSIDSFGWRWADKRRIHGSFFNLLWWFLKADKSWVHVLIFMNLTVVYDWRVVVWKLLNIFSSYFSGCCRWTYQEFFSRYRVLMKHQGVLSDRKQTCQNLMEKLIKVCLNLCVFTVNKQ